jgi:hypothetical protein
VSGALDTASDYVEDACAALERVGPCAATEAMAAQARSLVDHGRAVAMAVNAA